MSPRSDLATLRAEIDRIDDRLVDLLVERLSVVRRIAAAKGERVRNELALRPAREARILRRLLARAGERLPAATLVRMWRELLATSTRLQTPLTVSVFAPPELPAVWDVARDQFGSTTPLERAPDPRSALDRASRDPFTIAVLPMPREGEGWWTALLEPVHRALAAIARLPFVDGAAPEALALASLEPEPSDDDLSLVVLETGLTTSRAHLEAVLADEGLAPRWRAAARLAHRNLHLVEVDGFHARGDLSAPGLASALGEELRRAVVIGAYPRPIGEPVRATGPVAAACSAITPSSEKG